MRLLGALMVAVVIAGCGRVQGEQDPPPSSGPPNNPSTTPPPMGTNGQCNDLTMIGGVVSDTIATAVPAMNGGAMVDGTYVLTKYEWYSPNMLHSRTITLVVSGGGAYGQYLWTRDSEPEQRVTVNIATQSNQIAMRGVCPVGQDLEWDRYDTAGGLTLYSSRDNKAAFFVKQ
jgi:hypothetical protein